MPDLFVDVPGVGDGVRDLVTKDFAVPMPKAMYRALDGLLGKAKRLADLRVAPLTMFAGLQILDLLEQGRLALCAVIFAQPIHSSRQDRSRPALFVNLIRSEAIGRFDGGPLFLFGSVERDEDFSAPTLLRVGTSAFLGEKMFEERKQKRAKFPALMV